MNPASTRAPRLPVEERREAILDAAVPLLLAKGREVTTRELADAAGIAEGTIFRAFADKDELIEAAIARVMDPTPTIAAISAIEVELPLEDKVRAVARIMRQRFTHVSGIMRALDVKHPHGKHQHLQVRPAAQSRAADLFAPHANDLRFAPDRVVALIRVVVFGAAVPIFAPGDEASEDEVVALIMGGIRKEGN